MMRLSPLFAVPVVLSGLLACGGGSSSGGTPAPGLTYTNPAASATDYTLVKDTAASTSSVLVLDVMGPSGTAAVGVTFGFDVDATKAAWGASPVVANGGLFTSAQATPYVQGWVNGGRLQGIATYKGLSTQVSDLGAGIIAKISLTPVAGSPTGAVTLTDNGLGSSVDIGGTPIPIKVVVGTLTRN